MPELPEVETIRRQLTGQIIESRIVALSQIHSQIGRHQHPDTNPQQLVKLLYVTDVSRLGKRLKIELSDKKENNKVRASSDILIAIHLGMSGYLRYMPASEPAIAHTWAILDFENNYGLRYIDPRRFGSYTIYTEKQYKTDVTSKLGKDALNDTLNRTTLKKILSTRKKIKTILADQSIIAGLGNIYQDEVLWECKISPFREGSSLTVEQLDNMGIVIKRIMENAIIRGGTTLEDQTYRHTDDGIGNQLEFLKVYGREGKKCTRCQNIIWRDVLQGRSTFWCEHCQQ